MKCVDMIAFTFVVGLFTGLVAENYRLQHHANYFIVECVDNNLNYGEADRNERCQQAFKLLTGKE